MHFIRISPNHILNNFCTYVHPCLLSYFNYFLFSLIFTFRSGYICTFSHILILIPSGQADREAYAEHVSLERMEIVGDEPLRLCAATDA